MKKINLSSFATRVVRVGLKDEHDHTINIVDELRYEIWFTYQDNELVRP